MIVQAGKLHTVGQGMTDQKLIHAAFYRATTGAEPVREWLLGMTADDRRIIGYDIATAEFGWPVGMPVCRAMGEGLWEIRSNLSSNRISRIFFHVSEGKMILLHGIIKKTQQTPKADLDLARKRMKEN